MSMNRSNTLCRSAVVMICRICFFVITAAINNHVEAGTEVDFVLVGTVMSDEGKSIAIFEDNKTHAQRFHKLGDTIEGIRITKILKDRVFLTENDVEVELEIGYGTGSTHTYEGGNSRESLTSDDDLSELEYNVSQLYEDGVEIIEVEEGGTLSKLGLQPGDIVRDVNGSGINADLSFIKAVSLDFERHEGQLLDGMLRLEIVRNGEEKALYNSFTND
jgi:type II secretory pathway component PulC